MAYSVDATVNIGANVRETLASVPAASAPIVNHSAFAIAKQLNSSSTPDAELHVSSSESLTAGAKTLDLTAMSGTQGAVNFNGKAPRWIQFTNAGTNPMTFAKGATNGLTINGQTWSVTLKAGDTVAYYLTSSDNVAAGVKTIDVSGTGAEAFSVQIIAG